MNSFFSKLYTLLRSPQNRKYIFLGVVAIFAGIFGYASLQSAKHFTSDYSEYAVLAKAHQDAAYLLASPSNPVRLQLNKILSDVLSKRMAPETRLELATQGIDLTKQTERQLEAVSNVGEQVDTAIAKMQVNMLDAFSSSQQAKEVIALAKRRASIISDIRAYSYKADLAVQKIFERITSESGKLPDAYVIELNTAIPDLEDDFNKRSSLYTDLERTGEEMQRKFEEDKAGP